MAFAARLDVTPVSYLLPEEGRHRAEVRKHDGAQPIDGWQSAGLNRPSVLFAQVVSIDRMDVVDVVGTLGDADLEFVLDLCE